MIYTETCLNAVAPILDHHRSQFHGLAVLFQEEEPAAGATAAPIGSGFDLGYHWGFSGGLWAWWFGIEYKL